MKVLLENTIIFCLPQWLAEFSFNILTTFLTIFVLFYCRVSTVFCIFKRIPQIQLNYFRLPEKKNHFNFCYCDGWASGIAAWSTESNPKWAVNENKKMEFQKIEKFVINVKSIEINLRKKNNFKSRSVVHSNANDINSTGSTAWAHHQYISSPPVRSLTFI